MRTKTSDNEFTLEFPSRSSNEGFARSALACFAAQMDPTDNVLEITVKDRGRGIPDVEQARRPMFTTGGEERSGMGFTIMESFMDRLTVRSVPGRGTTVVLRKRLAPRVKAGR